MRDAGRGHSHSPRATVGRPVAAGLAAVCALAVLWSATGTAQATPTYLQTEYRAVGQDRSFRCDLVDELPGPPGVVIFGGSRATRFRPADFRLYAGLSAVNCATQNFRPEDAWAISNYLFSRAPQVKLRCFLAVQATTFSDAPLAPGLLYDSRLSQWFPASLIGQQRALAGAPYTPNMLGTKRYNARGLLLWNGYDARRAAGVPLEKTLAAYTRTHLRLASDTAPVPQVRSHLYFRKTIQLFNRHGVTPVVVIMPYQPTVLAAFREAGWEVKVDRLRKYLAGLQKRYELEVVDLLDIATFGGTPTGFYDGAHITAENARRIVKYSVGVAPECFRGIRYEVPPPRRGCARCPYVR